MDFCDLLILLGSLRQVSSYLNGDLKPAGISSISITLADFIALVFK